ncbi:MAG: hypothetical protein L0J73_06345, partial [Halomonas sp.]|nr:hypothetical protein [Halomonas sp.]
MENKILLISIFFLFSNYAISYERLSIVTSDWAAAETLSMLGVSPIAIAQLRNYQGWTGNEVIEKEALRRWVWNSPPELGQNMT